MKIKSKSVFLYLQWQRSEPFNAFYQKFKLERSQALNIVWNNNLDGVPTRIVSQSSNLLKIILASIFLYYNKNASRKSYFTVPSQMWNINQSLGVSEACEIPSTDRTTSSIVKRLVNLILVQ